MVIPARFLDVEEAPMVATLSACCRSEAERSLRKHRDVAICDGCGRLVLAWDNADDQTKTRAELERTGVAFAEEELGQLYVTSKDRAS